MQIILKDGDKQQTLEYTNGDIANMRKSMSLNPILEAIDRFLAHPTESHLMDKQIEETNRLRKEKS